MVDIRTIDKAKVKIAWNTIKSEIGPLVIAVGKLSEEKRMVVVANNPVLFNELRKAYKFLKPLFAEETD
jgi:hypothetical protein